MIFQHAHMYVTQLCCIVMGVLNPCVSIDSHEDFKVCMIMSRPLKVDRIQRFLLECCRLMFGDEQVIHQQNTRN
jgi:hypothetical protein